MCTLTLLVNLPQSEADAGKRIADEQNGVFISDSIEGPDTLGRVREVLSNGRNAVLHAGLRSAKARSVYLQTARALKARTEALLYNSSVKRHLEIPTYAEAIDRIRVQQELSANSEAKAYFQDREQQVIDNPSAFMRQLHTADLLLQYIPEYEWVIGLDQHSPYHTYNVFEHILNASSFVAGTNLKMAWTLLLHDIGKGYPGIKQFLGVFTEPYGSYAKKDRVIIENGERIRDGLDSGDFYLINGEQIPAAIIKTDLMGHFYEHENVGAQLALRILPRLGYTDPFAFEVATLIQFHMSMPRDMDVIQPAALKRWYAKVRQYAPELMMVRLADDRGK